MGRAKKKKKKKHQEGSAATPAPPGWKYEFSQILLIFYLCNKINVYNFSMCAWMIDTLLGEKI